MSGSHRVTFEGGAQTIRAVPLREDGMPVVVASADYAIVDLRYDADSASHVVASGAATIDSVSTTTTAAAGRSTSDPRVLTLTSAAGVTAGLRYLLSSGGRHELVQVKGIDGTTIRLASGVSQSFASGATFRGIEMSCSVPSGAAAEDDYLGTNTLAVRWSPLGLAPFVELIHVERTGPGPVATPEDLFALDPGLRALASDDMTAADALHQARADWSADLLAAGVSDDRMLAGPIGQRAVLHLAAYHMTKHLTDPAAVARATRYHDRYGELRNSLLNGLDKAKTARLTVDGAKEPPTSQSVWAVRF